MTSGHERQPNGVEEDAEGLRRIDPGRQAGPADQHVHHVRDLGQPGRRLHILGEVGVAPGGGVEAIDDDRQLRHQVDVDREAEGSLRHLVVADELHQQVDQVAQIQEQRGQDVARLGLGHLRP